MDFAERILNLDRVKVQLLISWLSHQEIVELIKSGNQLLEDYILENISRDGREILLDYLDVAPEDFEKRVKVRQKLNRVYLQKMEETGKVLKGTERKDLQKECEKYLSPQELEILHSREREVEKELSQGLKGKIENYVDRLERGKGLQR